MSTTNKYLWQKEVIDYTDSQTPDKVTVSLISVYGDQGPQGPQGEKGDRGEPGRSGSYEAGNYIDITGEVISAIPMYNAGDNVTITADETSAGIPDTYRELTYIQGDGTQYILTGVQYDSNSSYELSTTLRASSSQTTPSGSGWSNGAAVRFESSNNNLFYSNGSSSVTPIAAATKTDVTISFDPTQSTTSNYNYIPEGVAVYSDSRSNSGLLATTNYPLLAYTDSSGISGIMSGSIYRFTAKKDGVVIGDYVPVQRISDNEVGLYDIINNVFYINSGSGDFIPGDLVAPTYTISATDTTYTAGKGISISNQNVISIKEVLLLDCGTSVINM